MGSMSMIIIGDDWREQLLRFEALEDSHPSNPHIVLTDITQRMRRAHAGATQIMLQLPDGTESADHAHIIDLAKERGVPWKIVHRPIDPIPFDDWCRGQDLSVDEQPDLLGRHKCGWVTSGCLCEVVGASEFVQTFIWLTTHQSWKRTKCSIWLLAVYKAAPQWPPVAIYSHLACAEFN